MAAQDSATTKKPTARHSSKARKKPTKSTKSTAAPSKTAANTAAHRRKTKSKHVVTASRRSYQQQPTPERYKEIQEALAEKGYFNGPVDGSWNADSIDALKRFQREQNLTDDGKLGSLSLIALGLGPKRADTTERATQQ